MSSNRVLMYRAPDEVCQAPVVNLFPDEAAACAFVNAHLFAWSKRWAQAAAVSQLGLVFVAERGATLQPVWCPESDTLEALALPARATRSGSTPPRVVVEAERALRAVRRQHDEAATGQAKRGTPAQGTAPPKPAPRAALFTRLAEDVAWLERLRDEEKEKDKEEAEAATRRSANFDFHCLACSFLGCDC